MMKLKISYLLLLISCSIQAQIKPADGMWGTTDDPEIGSGLMMTTQNGTTVISLFTYDEAGNNVWYIGSGQVDEAGVLDVELRQTQNGTNIVDDNPDTASFSEQTKLLNLKFSGSQVATLSIDGSDLKSMQANHFGFRTFPTDQVILEDGTPYQFPLLDGQWVLGDPSNEQALIWDLEGMNTGSPAPPNNPLGFRNTFSSTYSLHILCPRFAQSIQPYCYVSKSEGGERIIMRIDLNDLNSQRMNIHQVSESENTENYQAFRLNRDNRLLPNDGHWRAYDDPEVGSGLVLRTQGIYTVALLYSYDDQGVPTWQIASGEFDENGYFNADLLTPSGGTAIESETQQAASFSEQVQTLEIQMQGLELATFSIDGSTPKSIQNSNFGVALDTTNHLINYGEPFSYPDQSGSWVLVDEHLENSRVAVLAPFDLNEYQTPPDPRLVDARQYEDVLIDDDSYLFFFCIKNLSSGNIVFQVRPYCYGSHYIRPSSAPLKMYFDDIGFSEFRYYIGEGHNGMDYSHIDRNSKMFYLFRLQE